MSYFDFNYDAEKAVEKDTLSTGMRIRDTDVYPGIIKLAYITKSDKSKAQAMNIEFEDDHGIYKEQIWFMNGQGKVVNDKGEYTKNFLKANSICLLACGKPLVKLEPETKTINLYNFEKKAEVPTDVPMLVDLCGKPITFAIQRIKENKQKKNDSGQYEPINEAREINAIAKVFRSKDDKTEQEIRGKQEVATFKDKWLEANKGQVWDRFKEVTGQGNAGAPGGNFAGAGFNPGSDNATTGDDPFTM